MLRAAVIRRQREFLAQEVGFLLLASVLTSECAGFDLGSNSKLRGGANTQR
jgi:hypothetical protein